MDEEGEVPLEGEEANTASITTSQPIVSKITPQLRGIHRTPAFNAGREDTTPENALKGNAAHRITGKTKQLT